MMRFEAYTKLFHRILQSSIWDLDDRTRIVWITLMAMTDENGCVIATVQFVARMARLDRTPDEIEDVREALQRFQEPDPDSITPTDDGRRLEKIEGGWRLINFKKYQEMMKQEARRETWRESKARAREKSSVPPTVGPPTQTAPEPPAPDATPPKPHEPLHGGTLRSHIAWKVAHDPITIADKKAIEEKWGKPDPEDKPGMEGTTPSGDDGWEAAT